MRSRKGLLHAVSAFVLTVALVAPFSASVSAADGAGPLDASKMPASLRARVSGLADLALSGQSGGVAAANRPAAFFPRSDECNISRGDNIKVNQNCLNVSDPDLQGRAQAQNETGVAVDPNNSQHIVTSYNDYRRGDGTCGTSYSLDGGETWNDSTVPNGFTRGNAGNIQHGTTSGEHNSFGFPREYWQGGGDTSVAWDSRGNAYLSCQIFNRGQPTSANPDASSGFVVFRSTQNNGASWDFTGRYVIVDDNVDGKSSNVALEDKQYMTIDNKASSPFRDRIYVTWTEFTAVSGYIYESFSNDYGQTFSPKVLVSPATTNSLCPISVTPGAGCDNNQFSQPFTAPDGTLYVVWDNYNTTTGPVLDNGNDDPGADTAAGGAAASAAPVAKDNHAQVLVAKSTDGGMTFSAPIKVADYFELPDCPAYQGGQDPGRSCVPEKGANMNSVFRAANYPSGAVDPHNSSQLVVSFGSYISKQSNETNGCVPQGFSGFGQPLYAGVKTAGACNNKIVISTSSNAGASFTGTTADVRTLPTVTGLGAEDKTDQWFQWLAFTPGGKVLVAAYDRAFGDDETSGASDMVVSSASNLSSLNFSTKRVTSHSMPVPTQFPDAQGASLFWGDYGAVAAAGEDAVPVWSDTRDADVFVCPGTAVPGTPPALCSATEPNGLQANDQDIFVDKIDVRGDNR
ncbi:MAG: exo-alpha-sialidase [Chloroflexi bacterium]|nr:exo-alpha-sialidase [Chloroflexota bacterium]